jgi:hypothetical protein
MLSFTSLRYLSQLVELLCSFVVIRLGRQVGFMVAIIGVWSEDKSKVGAMSVWEGEMPLVTKKSSRSGF